MSAPRCTCSMWANAPSRWCEKHAATPSPLVAMCEALEEHFPADLMWPEDAYERFHETMSTIRFGGKPPNRRR